MGQDKLKMLLQFFAAGAPRTREDPMCCRIGATSFLFAFLVESTVVAAQIL